MGEHLLHQPEQDLFESVLCGIIRYSLDDAPEMLEFNIACARIYGYDTKESFAAAVAHGQTQLVYFYDKELVLGSMGRCRKSHTKTNFGHRICRQDGTIAFIMGTLSPVTCEDGTEVIQAVFTDSGRRVVQEDVRKSIFYTPVRANESKERIIVASPDESLRRELIAILEGDYHVLETGTAQETLSVLGKERDGVAAVFVDGSIVSQNDFRFMATLKTSILYASIPILVVGENEEGAEEKFLFYGANDFMSRPLTPSLLRLRLAKLVELRDTAI